MDRNQEIKKELVKNFINYLNEATSSVGAGSFKMPFIVGARKWDKKQLAPFIEDLTPYVSPELAYDILDGKLDVTPDTAKHMERIAKERQRHVSKMNPNTFISDSIEQSVKSMLHEVKKKKEMGEDLGVWFGTKKKPKGSKQPKGPWVNICRKGEDGKHPPCVRPEADSKGYPKCRAAGVAGKMTDAQKKAACAQKRRAEKQEPKTGKGNAPTMTSYKPKKKK